VDAYPDALRHGRKAKIEIIPGIELTTQFDGREFHLLLPFIEWQNDFVKELVAEAAKRRFFEARARVKKLQEIGMDVQWEDVKKEAGPLPPVGMTIAMAFLKKAKKQGNPVYKKYYDPKLELLTPLKFYKEYLMTGKGAAVQKQSLDLLWVLEKAGQTGGVPVLAHPGANFMNANRRDLSLLREKGLEGLEVHTTYHTKEKTEKYRKLAKELNLVPTTGSDFHGILKPHVPFGCMEDGDYRMVEELKKRRLK